MIPEEKRQAAEKLVSFMPYFVNTKYEDAVHWVKNDSELGSIGESYPVYEKEFADIIRFIITSGLMDPYYINTISQNFGGEADFGEMVDALDYAKFEVCAALLTAIIKNEEYREGSVAEAFHERWFYTILYRIKELLEEE